MVHFAEQAVPGKEHRKQSCLVPRYWKSPVAPRDSGAIPLEIDEFKNWYVNVESFSNQRVVCREPQLSKRPKAKGFYIDTPSNFKAKTVVAVPIMCTTTPRTVVGTLTFDSLYSIKDLKWAEYGRIDSALADMLQISADLIETLDANDPA